MVPPSVAGDAFGPSYAPAVTSERLPAPTAVRAVEVVRRDRSIEGLASAVETVRSMATTPITRIVRRFVFVWLRVYVRETKNAKVERVNVRIPIPIPLVGGLLPPGLSRQKALHALALASASDDAAETIADYLDSVMAFEFVRVEEHKGADRHNLVVVGID